MRERLKMEQTMVKQSRPTQLFILGAGAAKPYGVPTWRELEKSLPEFIKRVSMPPKYLKERKGDVFVNPSPATILDEQQARLMKIIERVGGDDCPTIDKAISQEIKSMNGDTEAMILERVFFDVMMHLLHDDISLAHFTTDGKELLSSPIYQHLDNSDKGYPSKGWIGNLLWQDKEIGQYANFINFNYDITFALEIVRYADEMLAGTAPAREKEIDMQAGTLIQAIVAIKQRNSPKDIATSNKLRQQISSFENAVKPLQHEWRTSVHNRLPDILPGLFFPHGLYVFARNMMSDLIEDKFYKTYVDDVSELDSKKGGNPISCHDITEDDYVFGEIKNAAIKAEHLYVIGIKGGLDENLDKISLKDMGINKVVYTCPDPAEMGDYENYFIHKHGLVKKNNLTRVGNCDDFLRHYREKLMPEWQ